MSFAKKRTCSMNQTKLIIRSRAPQSDVNRLHHTIRPLFATIERDMSSGCRKGFKIGPKGELTVLCTTVADVQIVRDMIEQSGFEILPNPVLVGTAAPQNISEVLSPQTRERLVMVS
jgi:hypothetical protein